jgi:hypothetical protein
MAAAESQGLPSAEELAALVAKRNWKDYSAFKTREFQAFQAGTPFTESWNKEIPTNPDAVRGRRGQRRVLAQCLPALAPALTQTQVRSPARSPAGGGRAPGSAPRGGRSGGRRARDDDEVERRVVARRGPLAGFAEGLRDFKALLEVAKTNEARALGRVGAECALTLVRCASRWCLRPRRWPRQSSTSWSATRWT